jgi:hypothetical protein
MEIHGATMYFRQTFIILALHYYLFFSVTLPFKDLPVRMLQAFRYSNELL